MNFTSTAAAKDATSGTPQSAPEDRTSEAEQPVGERAARLSVLRRRVFYVARFAYWLCVHRSVSSARWVLQFEGATW